MRPDVRETAGMSDLAKRIANLPPEKRALFELLLAQEQDAPPASAPAATPPTADADIYATTSSRDVLEAIRSSRFSSYTYASADAKKTQTRQLYNLVSQQLNASPFGSQAFFLNLGYVPDKNPGYAKINLPAYALNKNCIRLVLEVIGDCDIGGDCATLDVGCGRGGTIAVLHAYFQPKKMLGVDLSSSAIAFCKKYHTYRNTHFVEGDSEKLPFASNSFDIVTNIESSHNYPDVFEFYREVSRVLRPNGYFLYTDLFFIGHLDIYLKFLQDNGFIVERYQDITTNVLLSCDELGKTHFNTFSRDNEAGFMDNFLGIPGSKLYNDMKDGKTTYRLFKLKKVP